MPRWRMSLLLILAAGCASTDPQRSATVHPQFSELRPVMVAVIIQSTTGDGPALDAAIRAELIERRYSPLAPGADPDNESGILLAVVTRERAEVTLSAPDGPMIYRMGTDREPGNAAGLAKLLLGALPPK